MNQYLKRISRALVKNNSLKKTALVAVLFLLLATGLVFLVQPAKAASITILSHSSFIDSIGSYWIFGEVQNLDTTPVGWVKVTATFYDSDNTLIATEDGYTGLRIILPNLKSPFIILLSNETIASRVDHYTLAVTSSQYTSTIPLDLKILSSSDHLDNIGWMHITGEVENQATTNATDTQVWATCYDSDGKVVAAFFDWANVTEMMPGQKSSFDIGIWSGRAPLVKSYVLTVTSSLSLTNVNKAASVTILSHSGYLDSVGGYRIFGEVQNLDTAPVGWLNITATFYDSSDTIIAVENAYSHLDVILPNRKSPFYVWLYDPTQNATQLGPRVDHYTLAVESAFEAQARPLGLKISSSSVHLDEFGYRNITGEVENTGTTNSTFTKVSATFYDSDGKVVATDYTFVLTTDNTTAESKYTLPPRQKSSFTLYLLENVSLAKSYVLTAESWEYECLEFSSLPMPTSTLAITVAWVPPPENAAAATVVTAVAVGAVSTVVAAATSPAGTSAGKAAEKAGDLLPESVKKWLTEYMSSKRKPALDQKTGSPFLPTKPEALAYAVSLVVLTISFSYVKVPDFTQILAVLPTILATAIIVEFVKNFSTVAFARKLGVWTEHRLWYFGLAMFLITTFAFGTPFSSPSRTLYYAPKLTKRREGIAYSAAILVTLAFAALFFAILVSGFTLIGSTGLAMCIIMAFLDAFPVSPMNGKAVYDHSKAAWAALFAATLAVYLSWLIFL
jgi:hypothetical protein